MSIKTSGSMSDASRINTALVELRRSKKNIMEAKRLLSMVSGDSDVRAMHLLSSVISLEESLSDLTRKKN